MRSKTDELPALSTASNQTKNPVRKELKKKAKNPRNHRSNQ